MTTPLDIDGGNSTVNCVYLKKKRFFSDLYEGIPETMVLNLIAWIMFILLFTMIRKKSWDYGRQALVSQTETRRQRWMQIFYAQGANDPQSFTDIGSGSIPELATLHEPGIFSWILVTLRLTKDQIFKSSGPDAVHYLSFQQHIMIVLVVMTFVSIGIILPVNFQGTLIGDKTSFGHTTLSNLSADSAWLWVHVAVAICYVPLVVFIMRRASGKNAFKKVATRSIMITNISLRDRDKEIVRSYLQELFPDVVIDKVEIAYAIKELCQKFREYQKVHEAKLTCQYEARTRKKIYMAKPNICSCKKVAGLRYYRQEEERLAGEVARLRAAAFNNPLGIAFVTLECTAHAQHIVKNFHPGTYREWNISFAPSPEDVLWENLCVSTSRWYIRCIAVNFFLFLGMFFLTTPVLIVNLLDVNSLSQNEAFQKISPLISELLPTLMLLTLACLLPYMVSLSDRWFLQHWTKSLQNYSIMTKTFGYLLFMILILPSLGLTSANAFIGWTIEAETIRLHCIFLPEKGAFFVNYVLSTAFIGTSLELLRFPDLIFYTVMYMFSQSKAELPYIRKEILVEFPFGMHYAWTVLIFTMSVFYSLICPIIMPAALIYICMKHFVDRHNIYFAYRSSNMMSQPGGKIHSTAVTMTKVSVVLLLTLMGTLFGVRGQSLGAPATVLFFTLFTTVMLFASMSHITRWAPKKTIVEEPLPEELPVYVAEALMPIELQGNTTSSETLRSTIHIESE